MSNFQFSKVDTIGRLLIPAKVRNPLGWNIGDKLYAIPSPDGKTVVLQAEQNGSGMALAIDDFGRITLPQALRAEMQWQEGSTLNLVCNEKENRIALVFVAKQEG